MTTPHLITTPNFRLAGSAPQPPYAPGDAFVEQLLAAHRGLDDAASQQLNARLVLLLANHIGDLAVLDEALAVARAGLGGAGPEARP
ncbi:MAG: DUF2783 domain-containing protein [Burkholderiaceae bacterium]|jgi:hypothetical protein|nr:DUF2783 domain-containing protein [Burkholderiaceae bacterium]MCZ8175777.1 DUF2783 domain-containing protein [Burkholderiaceae bacterium]